MRGLWRWIPEILLIGFLWFMVSDAVQDGRYSKALLSWKKHSTTLMYMGIALLIYLAWRQLPGTQDVLVNYATGQLESQSPIVRILLRDWMRSVQRPLGPLGGAAPIPGSSGAAAASWTLLPPSPPDHADHDHRGERPTRRAVSETRKKFVAANQGWVCGMCRSQLDHTFEVDHRTRLEYGGSNDVENLVALCRNCHGRKTAHENM